MIAPQDPTGWFPACSCTSSSLPHSELLALQLTLTPLLAHWIGVNVATELTGLIL